MNRCFGYEIHKGSIDAKAFGGFLINLLHEHQNIQNNRDKYVFVLINATIHRVKVLHPF